MENSSIEWTHHTFNPWIGCTKVSPGCKHCYAEAMMDKRYGRVKWGTTGTRSRTSASNWRKPLTWNRKAERTGIRQRVFCASLADIFEDRPELDKWRDDLFNLIMDTPWLDWLLLTKRPENIDLLWWDTMQDWGNVWLGTSVENQEQAEIRIPELLEIPVRIRFLSCEPLLDHVDLSKWLQVIGWVIVGGESGPNARPMYPDWARSLRDQCKSAGVKFFMKQMDKKQPIPEDLFIREIPQTNGAY